MVAVGRNMDDGRRVTFQATSEELVEYWADPDEDAYLEIGEWRVVKVSGRPGRDLWSTAGLDQQPS